MDDDGYKEGEVTEIAAEEAPDAAEKGSAAANKLLKRLAIKYRPNKENYCQKMTLVVQDPILATLGFGSSSSRRQIPCTSRSATP
jgi:hypothetical protein